MPGGTLWGHPGCPLFPVWTSLGVCGKGSRVWLSGQLMGGRVPGPREAMGSAGANELRSGWGQFSALRVGRSQALALRTAVVRVDSRVLRRRVSAAGSYGWRVVSCTSGS